MQDFETIGRAVMILGAILIILGLIMSYADRLLSNFHGLPGDIVIKKQNFSFYFPMTSLFFLSFILSAIFWFIHKK